MRGYKNKQASREGKGGGAKKGVKWGGRYKCSVSILPYLGVFILFHLVQFKLAIKAHMYFSDMFHDF